MKARVEAAGVRVVGFLATLFALVGVYSVRQADPDLFGYLSYGRLFWNAGGLIVDDPFSYTAGGAHWVSFEYGAQVLLWGAYHLGGAAGLIALKCVVGGLTLYLLSRVVRTASPDPIVWLPVFLLSVSAVSRFFLFRPQLFTFAAFSAFVLVLVRHLLDRRSPLWMLPLLALVWANLHGGFVAGLGAIGLAIGLRACSNAWPARAESRAEVLAGSGPLWLALGACVAASFITPHGFGLWRYVIYELTHSTNREYIAEWAPASLDTDPWSLAVLVLLTAILAVVSIASWRSAGTWSGPPPLCWAASCVPLLLMSYVSVRHLPLAALWTAPVIVLLASRALDDERASWRRLWSGASVVSAVPISLTLGIVMMSPSPSIRLDGRSLGLTNPCGAAQFMSQRRLQGNVYGPLWWGAYITWRLHPDIRVSMDGRNVSLYADDLVLENLRFYSMDPGEADLSAPLRHQTDYLLVPTDVPVYQRVSSEPQWQAVYRDADAVLFAWTPRPRPPVVEVAASVGRVSCAPL